MGPLCYVLRGQLLEGGGGGDGEGGRGGGLLAIWCLYNVQCRLFNAIDLSVICAGEGEFMFVYVSEYVAVGVLHNVHVMRCVYVYVSLCVWVCICGAFV